MNIVRLPKYLSVLTAVFIALLGLLSFFQGFLLFVLSGIADPVDPVTGKFSTELKERYIAIGSTIFILSGIVFLVSGYTAIRWIKAKARPRMFTIVLMVVEIPWIILGSLLFHEAFVYEGRFSPIYVILPLIIGGSIVAIKALRVGKYNTSTSDSSVAVS